MDWRGPHFPGDPLGAAMRETVLAPQPHEGVGGALRRAFGARRVELPDDLRRLLDRLDG